MIDVEFNFFSNREDMSFNYYLLQPKTRLETLIIKNLDKYPQKLKILDYSKAPYFEYLILKYYGYVIIQGHILFYLTNYDWRNNAPREPDNDFKEVLRNR